MPRPIDLIEDTDRDVIVVETAHSTGYVIPAHTHRRVQLLHATTGIMRLETKYGAWIVPPGFAVWIPAGVVHKVHTVNVVTRSLYVRGEALASPPAKCRVIEVSPLLRELIASAMKVPLFYDRASRDGKLMEMVLAEASAQPEVFLHLPMPAEPHLAALCHAFFEAPTQASPPAAWAARLHVSERTFSRRFLASTGMTFMGWRQQACVLVAMSRLSLGDSVTRIALDMGYESPSSFSTMFKKAMGVAPTAYGRSAGAARRVTMSFSSRPSPSTS
jgi:AraC-like DNA-binding protein